ncbi:hypothetical protein HHL08_02610 [Sphingobium sp. AR-3-1]|uniref:Uncharacterized protein n=1 Tax=Sphingobium psychrophilum TaxID=2728834 RepID=A0A7X9WSD9_9SPHN|nr:hypothetical protein [Sphingobium psychrophilum]NML09045.1 hypothetical protein [Sphingobium psychrophilum]
MATLLHEYWENDDGAEFAVVRERNDELRPVLTPNARLVFSVLATSWHEAMQLQYDRLDYGTYDAVGLENYIYTDDEAVQQQEYLKHRNDS